MTNSENLLDITTLGKFEVLYTKSQYSICTIEVHEVIMNIKALGLVVPDMNLFYSLTYAMGQRHFWPQGHNLNKHGRSLQDMMLHTKYQGALAFWFQTGDFFYVFPI